LEKKFALFKSRVFIVFDLSLEKRGKNRAAKTGVLHAVKWWVAGINSINKDFRDEYGRLEQGDGWERLGMLLMRAASITRANGRGLGLLGPKWHSAIGSMPFHRA
jgi:hypothetical protein